MKVLKNQVTPSFLSLFSCWGCDGQISQGQPSFLLEREGVKKLWRRGEGMSVVERQTKQKKESNGKRRKEREEREEKKKKREVKKRSLEKKRRRKEKK